MKTDLAFLIPCPKKKKKIWTKYCRFPPRKPQSRKWFSFTPLLGHTAQIKNFLNAPHFRCNLECWGLIILCRTQDDLLSPSLSSWNVTPRRLPPPMGRLAAGSQGNSWDPTVPLSAPRADANLSPERSAARATVQVGKTLPWGSEHRPTVCSTARDVVTVQAPPL